MSVYAIYSLLLLTCAVGTVVEAPFANGAVGSLNVIRIFIPSLFLKLYLHISIC
jgi:hypothetical protein